MIKNNPVSIDGNLFLMAHSSAILGNMSARDIIHNSTHENPMYRGRGIIIKSMLAMIFKNIKDMFDSGLTPTSVFLLWDKRDNGKYHKSNIIDTLDSDKGYKGDRDYITEEDILATESELKLELSADQKRNLETKLLDQKKSFIIGQERHIARQYIIDNFGKFGIPSFSYMGYEADDLDLIFALETEKSNGCHIHYSGDSDWSFNLRPNDVFWQVNRSKLYRKSSEDVRKKFNIRADLELLEWAELFYSAKGSHNFLQRTLDPSIKRITVSHLNKLFDRDFSDISDMERFNVQRKCFKLQDFPNYDKVTELYTKASKFEVSASVEDFKNMLDDLSISDDVKFFMNKNYQEFLSKIRNSTLNQLEF